MADQRGFARLKGMIRERNRRHVAVIGGGIAGLAAAHSLIAAQPSVQVTLLEGSAEVGGKLQLGEVAGLSVDLGAESILNRRSEGTDLARGVGLTDSLVHPELSQAGIWTRGAVRPLPPTLMGIPTDLMAAARSGILRRGSVLRMAMESRLPRLDISEDVGIGTMVARRLGRDVRDRLVDPLLGGVYAGRSDELSLYAALPQLVAAIERHGGLRRAATSLTPSPSTGRSATPLFAGIKGGVGRLATETARAVVASGGEVRCYATVRALNRTPLGWRLAVGPATNPQHLDVDAVVLAVPAAPAARLLRDDVPSAARELARIEYASLAVVTLAVAADRVNGEFTGTGFLVPPVDRRVIKASTYSSRKWAWLAGGTTMIRCSVGRHRDEAELQHDDDELVAAALMDLHAATGLRAPLLDSRVTRWGGALPQYAVGHLDRVRRIRAAVADQPHLEVCGAAFDGVGIPAVIATGRAAATRVIAGLGAAETMKP